MTDDATGWQIHLPTHCRGQFCCFHNPSKHHMVTWKKNLRTDWGVALIERICPHGVGHPDPDSVAWLERTSQGNWGIHGCDGCCNAKR